jgi:hypothetical protein
MFIKKLGVQIGKKWYYQNRTQQPKKPSLFTNRWGTFIDMHKDGFYFMCRSEKNWGAVESNWDLTGH